MRAATKLVCAVLAILCVVSGCSTANTGETPGDELSLQPQSKSSGKVQLVKALPPPTGTNDGAEQLLSPDDVLEINVYDVTSLDRTVQIDSAGRISLPLIGVVTAAGKSVRQLEQELRQAYGATYLRSPDISVFVKDSVGRRVTVDGEVGKPGVYQVSAHTSLLDSIAMAGGFRDVADQSKVFVFRDVGGRKLVANYNVGDIRSGSSPDPVIDGGDIVMVFTSRSQVALNNLKDALGIAANARHLAIP
ncbi:MAG: polysaccharide export protein [Mesorhizobium sp.]|uniref:polysaccharide biosynthesis/export family protein n=1 Tax=Mesorhizobium sp. TaxID=1871066 RepID=UPI0012099DB9|nr:polysaccharide biosynthesis/export family protein [Mesorhizobium sp.]TIP05730.1 MAG: polysaccharide export protein [Mesorhizobium sp.]